MFTHNEQEFKIINFYLEYLDYVNHAKNQSENLDELYMNTVVEPFRISAFGEDDGYSAINSWIFSTPTDIEKMEKYVNSLTENQHKINDLIEEALRKSSDKLSGVNKEVYIFPSNPDFPPSMKPSNGVTGITWNKDFMFILIEPSFLEEDLTNTVAHEYHHTVYLENNELKPTLLEISIIEGKATAFADTIYPDFEMPFTSFSSSQMEKDIWNFFNMYLNESDPTILEEFQNGNPNLGIPKWATYRMGYRIVESFFEVNQNISIKEWTNMAAGEILVGSKYEEKY